MMIPWLLMLLLVLFCPILSRVVWATPDTSWLSDTLHDIKTRFAVGGHWLGVLNNSARPGEGVGNGGKTKNPFVLDVSEQFGVKYLTLAWICLRCERVMQLTKLLTHTRVRYHLE